MRATSAGSAGRPVKISLARRMSTSRGASGAGSSPAASSRASTKRSMSLRHQSAALTAGGSHRSGCCQHQWSALRAAMSKVVTRAALPSSGQGRPRRTHSSIVAIALSGSLPSGGICWSLSYRTTLTSRLSSGLPATATPSAAKKSARESNDRPASGSPASAEWQSLQ